MPAAPQADASRVTRPGESLPEDHQSYSLQSRATGPELTFQLAFSESLASSPQPLVQAGRTAGAHLRRVSATPVCPRPHQSRTSAPEVDAHTFELRRRPR